jgi:type I restriction enzyme S subunit
VNDGDEDGGLPEGWALAPLGQIADCRLGKMLDKAKNRGDLRPYLRNVNVQWGRIDLDDIKEIRVTPEEAEQYAVLPGDLLVCEGGEPGRCAVWTDGREMYLQKALHRVRPRGGKSGEYLRWWLQHAASTGRLETLFTGSTIKHLPGRQLARVPVALPPVPEQRRIVARIDEIEKRRSAAAARLQAARGAVERFRGAVLTAACSGRLTADWREEHPDGSAAEPTQGDSEVRPLFDAPDLWRWASLDAVAEIRGGIQVGARRKAAEPLREVPYLRVANVQRGWLDLSEVKTIAAPEGKIAALRLELGDIFFNEGGDRDKLGRGWVWEGQIDECIHQNHVFRARLRDGGFEPRFYSWFGNSFGTRYFIDEGKQTVNLASLSKTRLGRLPVPVPPIAEQREIVRRVDAMLETAESLAGEIEHAAATLKRVSKASLAKAFRGELVPTEAAVAEEDSRPLESARRLVGLGGPAESTPSRRRRQRTS